MRSEKNQPVDAAITDRRGSDRRSVVERRQEGRPSAKRVRKKVLTTGQVAKICRVAPRTVCKWFDSGRLPGYRIPGGQDRRIPREHLIRFLKEHGMPVGELEGEGLHKILIIGATKLFVNRIRKLLPEEDDFKYELANSGFAAGTLAESFHPNTIIIDLAMGRSEALQIVSNLRRYTQFAQALIIALASEDEAAPETLVSFGFSEASRSRLTWFCSASASGPWWRRSARSRSGWHDPAGGRAPRIPPGRLAG
jgi:excisionase family DNA binding protein